MENSEIKNQRITRGKVRDKRGAILDAALHLITSYGFHGTSIKMIAAKAEVAAGTIYIHFKNKEELILALYEALGEEINEIIRRQVKKDVTYFENFLAIWTAILECYIADPRKPEFISQFTYSPYITRSDASAQNKLLAPVQLFFTEGKEKRLLKDMPIASLVALTHGPITSLVRMSKYEQIILREVEIKQYATACWDAIRSNEQSV